MSLEATDTASREKAVSEIIEKVGSIDLLINNAGAAPDVFAVEPVLNDFSKTIDTNITGRGIFHRTFTKPY